MNQLAIRNSRLAESAAQGVQNFQQVDWSRRTARDEFLATIALRIVLAGYLIGRVTRTTTDTRTEITVTLDPQSSATASPDRVRAAQLIVAPLGIYADGAQLSAVFGTTDEVGAVPIPIVILGGVVSVSLIGAGGAVLWNVVEHASEVVENALKRDSASKAVQQVDGKTLEIMQSHVQREQIAGRTLEFDATEKSILQALQERVGKIVDLAYAPTNKGFPVWTIPAGLGAAAILTALIWVLKAERRKS
jgi:hypothetical protein